jgi:hypothetical protein
MTSVSDFFVKYKAKIDELYPIKEADKAVVGKTSFYPGKTLEQSIVDKEEFSELKLLREAPVPEPGEFLNSQLIVQRYMSGFNLHDEILLFHETGTGKTCAAIAIIEKCLDENLGFDKVLVFGNSEKITENFQNELLHKCASERYNMQGLSREERAVVKKALKRYQYNNYGEFFNKNNTLSNDMIVKQYNNSIIFLDEVHNLVTDKEETEKYKLFKRIIQALPNRKVILASATPMINSPIEIAQVMNLILPLSAQLSQKEFKTDFLKSDQMDEDVSVDEDGSLISTEVFRVKNDAAKKELIEKFAGRVSYVSAPQSTVLLNFVGETIGPLRTIKTIELEMSQFQSDVYEKTFDKNQTFYGDSRHASLMVFPNGSYGEPGDAEYLQVNKIVKMTSELKKFLRADGPDKTAVLGRVKELSATFGAIVESLLSNRNKNSFVFSQYIKGGINALTKILDMFGYSEAKYDEMGMTPGLRYAVMTGESKNLKKILEVFNTSANRNGDFIQVIIGSEAISEGLSFKNIQNIYIATPAWNYASLDQTIARGIRFGSHADLGPDVTVNVHLYVNRPRDPYVLCIDELMYQSCEAKDISIKQIERLLKEAAFDCALTKERNVKTPNYSRACDYMSCEYKCHGVSDALIRKDYLTYNLLYPGKANASVYSTIRQLLQQGIDSGRGIVPIRLSEVHNITRLPVYTIIDSITTLNKKDKAIMFVEGRPVFLSYSYNVITPSFTKQKSLFDGAALLIIDAMRSRNTLEDYVEFLQREYGVPDQFIVMKAVTTLVSNNVVIMNRQGSSGYIRESNGCLYIAPFMDHIDTVLDNAYLSNPFFYEKTSMKQIQNDLVPDDIVDKLVANVGKETFVPLLADQPIDFKATLLEAALEADYQNIQANVQFRQKVLEYFENYFDSFTWTDVDRNEHFTIVHRLDDKRARCFTDGGEWTDCDEKMEEKLDEEAKRRDQVMMDGSPELIWGVITPDGTFKIRDLKGFNFELAKGSEKRPGQDCGTTNTDIVLNYIMRLGLDYDPETVVTQKLKDKLQQKLEKVLPSGTVQSDDVWKRFIYWYSIPNRGTRCDEVKQKFLDQDLIMKNVIREKPITQKKESKPKAGPSDSGVEQPKRKRQPKTGPSEPSAEKPKRRSKK